jgi:hypothetical protein
MSSTMSFQIKHSSMLRDILIGVFEIKLEKLLELADVSSGM